MKIALPFIAASLLIASLSAGVPCRADEPKTPLGLEMDGIAKDFRALHKMVANPAQKDTALGLVKDMETHATKAKNFDPIKTKQIPPADKDKFLADYRSALDGLIADMGKLETAINSGNTAGASALLDKMGADKREGHKQFNAEDDNKPGK